MRLAMLFPILRSIYHFYFYRKVTHHSILMLFCTILTEFCGLLAQTINGVRSYAGPFGKSDRALIFGLWGLAVAIYPQWMQWNNLLWSIASILLLWTAINRCRSVLLMSAEI